MTTAIAIAFASLCAWDVCRRALALRRVDDARELTKMVRETQDLAARGLEAEARLREDLGTKLMERIQRIENRKAMGR